MDSDDVCRTGLDLGLGLGSDHHHQQHNQKKLMPLKYDHLMPSLTLGPSGGRESYQTTAAKIEAIRVGGDQSGDDPLQPQASCFSGVSSFSNSSSVKRDRDLGGEDVEVEAEAEVERVYSRVSTEDLDEEGSPRKKLRLTKEQSATLEDRFREHTTLNPKQKQELARQLNLRPRQVEVWFQNRRARTKLKQTETDCELLKKCCETLTEENKRLKKELQELKASKLTPPFYMQFPTATITVCPSCERVCNGAGDGSPAGPFSIGAKRHFFNPFTHPSAAC